MKTVMSHGHFHEGTRARTTLRAASINTKGTLLSGRALGKTNTASDIRHPDQAETQTSQNHLACIAENS